MLAFCLFMILFGGSAAILANRSLNRPVKVRGHALLKSTEYKPCRYCGSELQPGDWHECYDDQELS